MRPTNPVPNSNIVLGSGMDYAARALTCSEKSYPDVGVMGMEPKEKRTNPEQGEIGMRLVRRLLPNPLTGFHQPETVMQHGLGLVGRELLPIQGFHDVRTQGIFGLCEQIGFGKGLVGSSINFQWRAGFFVVPLSLFCTPPCLSLSSLHHGQAS